MALTEPIDGPAVGLPAAVAQAVKKTPADAVEPDEPVESVESGEAAPPSGGEVAVAEGQTAADVARSIRWLGVTYRPPDVWRERQPSLAEEFDYVMKGSHLPEGPWRGAARVYAAPALGVIAALHVAIWVLRSPARHITAWLLAAVVAGAIYIV